MVKAGEYFSSEVKIHELPSLFDQIDLSYHNILNKLDDQIFDLSKQLKEKEHQYTQVNATLTTLHESMASIQHQTQSTPVKSTPIKSLNRSFETPFQSNTSKIDISRWSNGLALTPVDASPIAKAAAQLNTKVIKAVSDIYYLIFLLYLNNYFKPLIGKEIL